MWNEAVRRLRKLLITRNLCAEHRINKQTNNKKTKNVCCSFSIGFLAPDGKKILITLTIFILSKCDLLKLHCLLTLLFKSVDKNCDSLKRPPVVKLSCSISFNYKIFRIFFRCITFDYIYMFFNVIARQGLNPQPLGCESTYQLDFGILPTFKYFYFCSRFDLYCKKQDVMNRYYYHWKQYLNCEVECLFIKSNVFLTQSLSTSDLFLFWNYQRKEKESFKTGLV